MKLWDSLFIKLFIAFWLMTIAILGSWQLASNYLDAQPPAPISDKRHPSGTPNRFILRTIYSLENLSVKALPQKIENIQKKHGIQIYLITPGGSDFLGRKVPAKVEQISDKSNSVRQKRLMRTSKGGLSTFSIYRPEQGALTAVFVFPQHRRLIVNALTTSLWLRITLAVFISGAICFGLSRLMTNRLKDLQLASRRLATGDLDTRLEARDRGGDETDELARDFNSMAEQLQERIEAQKRLLGDVSHELRSPLARLRVALVLAEQKPEQKADYLHRIEQEAERLEALVSQLLSSQDQDITLDLQVDLVAVLEKLCLDANFEGQVAGKRFSFKTDRAQADVDSCTDLLRKSFDNILRNALHHTVENSEVTVSLSSIEDAYQVVIEDQGPGVPEGDLDKIFKEFYRVDSARSPNSGGHGLGLAIAKRALRQHGGKVTAANTGTGLKITVILPQPKGNIS